MNALPFHPLYDEDQVICRVDHQRACPCNGPRGAFPFRVCHHAFRVDGRGLVKREAVDDPVRVRARRDEVAEGEADGASIAFFPNRASCGSDLRDECDDIATVGLSIDDA